MSLKACILLSFMQPPPCSWLYAVQAGQIVDDEINAVLVNPLLPGVRLHAVIDACHSGSAMDLEYRCKVKQVGLNWKQEYAKRTRMYKVPPFTFWSRLMLPHRLGTSSGKAGSPDKQQGVLFRSFIPDTELAGPMIMAAAGGWTRL